MYSSTWRFEAAGRRLQVKARYGMESFRLRVLEGDTVLAEREYPSGEPDSLDPQSVTADLPEGRLEVTLGAIGWWTMACQARLNGELVFRSKKEDFRTPQALKRMLQGNSSASDEERKAKIARAKARMPAIYVDIGMAILFFLVASRTPDWELYGLQLSGLQTAALVGAGVTLALFVVQRFVKSVDLLGGFAVFGMVMALISASLAIAFQDDLWVKLRGTVVGLIAASAFLIDGLFGGRYLGQRMAGYLEQLIAITPRRAAFAVSGAGLVIAGTDLTALALPDDLWLIYNSFLDSLVAFPIVFAAFWLARERKTR